MNIFEQLLYLLTAGGIISALIELLKSYRIPAKMALVFFALFAGIGYQLFVTYIDPSTQNQIAIFVSGVIGTAMLIYEFIFKKLKDDN